MNIKNDILFSVCACYLGLILIIAVIYMNTNIKYIFIIILVN